MSYARWSNSHWYAFYNVNGKLSLWYDTEKTINWEYSELKEIMAQDETKIPEFFQVVYDCTLEEAKEAIGFIKLFFEDYDPQDELDYNKEVSELLAKWGESDESKDN